MGIGSNGGKRDTDHGKDVPSLAMSDVILGNVKKRAREHQDKTLQDNIHSEKDNIEKR